MSMLKCFIGPTKTYHSRPSRQVLMPCKPPAAGKGSRATAFARVPCPTHRNSESLQGSDEHLQKKWDEDDDKEEEESEFQLESWKDVIEISDYL